MKRLFFLLSVLMMLSLVGCRSDYERVLNEGIKLYEDGKYADAQNKFLECARNNQNNADIYNYLGMTFIELEDLEQAIACFDQSILINPEQMSAYRGKGIAKMELKEYDSAISSFRDAISHTGLFVDENDYDILCYRAKAEEEGGFYLEACDTYEALIKLGYHVDEMYYRLGLVYLKLNQIENTLMNFQKCVESCNQDFDRIFEIYQTLENAGYAQMGIAYINMILTKQDNSDHGKISRGKAYYILGKYENAINEFKDLPQVDYPECCFYIGICHEQMGNMALAKTNYKNYVDTYNRITPYTQAIYAQYAYVSSFLGDYNTAATMLEKAIGLGYSSIYQNLYWNRMVNYMLEKDYESALEVANMYEELFPEDTNIKDEIAFLQMQCAIEE